ncbi:hypothetical protein AMTR_s00063p00197850 [Amborella trichopoda]|uniref:Uncharacterized protein n=1 Tax=Amborella trichopoda TaxID=13333 RepID=U5D228_AMBTC|nr:hypothetical protein AMTR_s00063p00197850 [Amborella trichopoda]
MKHLLICDRCIELANNLKTYREAWILPKRSGYCHGHVQLEDAVISSKRVNRVFKDYNGKVFICEMTP